MLKQSSPGEVLLWIRWQAQRAERFPGVVGHGAQPPAAEGVAREAARGQETPEKPPEGRIFVSDQLWILVGMGTAGGRTRSAGDAAGWAGWGEPRGQEQEGSDVWDLEAAGGLEQILGDQQGAARGDLPWRVAVGGGRRAVLPHLPPQR